MGTVVGVIIGAEVVVALVSDDKVQVMVNKNKFWTIIENWFIMLFTTTKKPNSSE